MHPADDQLMHVRSPAAAAVVADEDEEEDELDAFMAGIEKV